MLQPSMASSSASEELLEMQQRHHAEQQQLRLRLDEATTTDVLTRQLSEHRLSRLDLPVMPLTSVAGQQQGVPPPPVTPPPPPPVVGGALLMAGPKLLPPPPVLPPPRHHSTDGRVLPSMKHQFEMVTNAPIQAWERSNVWNRGAGADEAGVLCTARTIDLNSHPRSSRFDHQNIIQSESTLDVVFYSSKKKKKKK